MKKVGTALIAVVTLFVALTSPAEAAGLQYAIIQKKRIDVGFRSFPEQSHANLVQIDGVNAWNLNSDFRQVAAGWITDLPQPKQVREIYFNCRKLGRGVFFKNTAEPIVRVEYAIHSNPAQHLLSTIPGSDVKADIPGKPEVRRVVLNPVDGQYPIIFKIGIIARHDDRGTFIKDHADFTVWGLSLHSGGTITPVHVDVMELGVREDVGPKYDKFINEAFHI